MINKLGDYLKQKREYAKLKQIEVGKLMGWSSAQFISNWERGLSFPPVSIIKKLSKIYGSEPSEMFALVVEKSLDHYRNKMVAKYEVSR